MMKNRFLQTLGILFVCLVSFNSAYAQSLTATNSNVEGYNPVFTTHANVVGTSDLGNEQYTVTLQNRAELIGISANVASSSQVGDVLIDPNGGIYEIISGSFPTFTVQFLNDPANLPEPYFGFPAAPTSPVNIARPIGDCGLLPFYAFLGAGIDSRLVHMVVNYNYQRIADCVGTGGGGGNDLPAEGFRPDGTQTDFTVTFDLTTTRYLVELNGQTLYPDDFPNNGDAGDYFELNSTTVRFNAAPPEHDPTGGGSVMLVIRPY